MKEGKYLEAMSVLKCKQSTSHNLYGYSENLG